MGHEEDGRCGELGIESIGTLWACDWAIRECKLRIVEMLVLAVHSSWHASIVVVVVVNKESGTRPERL